MGSLIAPPPPGVASPPLEIGDLGLHFRRFCQPFLVGPIFSVFCERASIVFRISLEVVCGVFVHVPVSWLAFSGAFLKSCQHRDWPLVAALLEAFCGPLSIVIGLPGAHFCTFS